MYIMVLSLLES